MKKSRSRFLIIFFLGSRVQTLNFLFNKVFDPDTKFFVHYTAIQSLQLREGCGGIAQIYPEKIICFISLRVDDECHLFNNVQTF